MANASELLEKLVDAQRAPRDGDILLYLYRYRAPTKHPATTWNVSDLASHPR